MIVAADYQQEIDAAIAEIDECLRVHAVAVDEAHDQRRLAELAMIVERFTQRVAARFGPVAAAAVAGALTGILSELRKPEVH